MTECDAAPARLPLAPARKLTGCGAAAAPTHAWWYTYLLVTGATPIVAHPVVLTPFNYFKRYDNQNNIDILIRSYLYIHVILRSFSKHSRDRATSKLCTSKLLDTWKRWSQRIGKPLLFKLGGKNGVKFIILASVSHSAVEASTFQLRCKG